MTLFNPGVDHTSPQGNYRTFPSVLIGAHRPTRAHRKAFSAVTSSPASVTPQDYDTEVIRYQGHPYSQRGDRCGQNCVCQDCGSFDCSGLLCHVNRILGIGIGCATSFVMATMCYDDGLYLPLAQARGTQSHWAVKGRDLGRRPGPFNEGHIVDGRGIVNGRAETMEAMGTRWGCLIASWDGRGWDAAYLIPGVNYKPAPMFKEQDMIWLPGKSSVPGRDRIARWEPNGLYVEILNGGHIAGMDGPHPSDPPNVRRWYPKNADGSAAPTAANPGDGLDTHALTPTGGTVVASLKNGATYRGTIVVP